MKNFRKSILSNKISILRLFVQMSVVTVFAVWLNSTHLFCWSVFRPSDRVRYLLGSASGCSAAQFGLSFNKIFPADFDGDGSRTLQFSVMERERRFRNQGDCIHSLTTQAGS